MIVLLLAAIAIQSGGATESDPAVCGRLRQVISADEKKLGQIEADGIADLDAAHTTARASREAADFAEIAINIALMQQHQCQPYPRAISSTTYIGAGLRCNQAISASVAAGQSGIVPQECSSNNWSPPAP